MRVVRHSHAVDCIFRAHLLGEKHGLASANPEGHITLAALQAHVRETDAWYVAYASALDVQGGLLPLRASKGSARRDVGGSPTPRADQYIESMGRVDVEAAG